MTEYYKNKTARIFYDSELDTLFLEYTSKVLNHDQFVEINTAVLNAFTQLNTQKFVADIRKMGVISVASQQWVVNNLLPGMVKHLKGKKLCHAQFLDPSEIFSKVSASNIQKNSHQVAEGFVVMQFSDMDELKKQLRAWA